MHKCMPADMIAYTMITTIFVVLYFQKTGTVHHNTRTRFTDSPNCSKPFLSNSKLY